MSENAKTQEGARCVILRHATELFAHYGYAKTNIGDIAKCCCMSPGNLYRYFKNKQGIGEEVVREHLADFQISMGDALAATEGDFEQRLRAMIRRGIDDIIKALQSDPKIVELADMICAGDSGILRRHIEWIDSQFVSLLQEGMDAGVLAKADPTQQAQVVHDAISAFWNPTTLAYCDLELVPHRVDAILDVLLKGMRA